MINSLYKFSPNRAEFFDNFLIRASNKHALNDPFEVHPSAEALIDLIANIGNGTFGSDRDEIGKFISEHEPSKQWELLGQPFFSDTGIISLTETKDNLLMWSHYANQHNGYVIEFNALHPFFTTHYTSSNRSLIGETSRVLYRKERLCDLSNGNLMEVYFHKSDEWAYEKESRLLVPFDSADIILVDKKSASRISCIKDYFSESNLEEFNINFFSIENAPYPKNLHELSELMFMFKVPKESIKSITFGARTKASFVQTAREKLSKNQVNIPLYQATIDPYDYRLRFQPI
ncbi:DUF2971 domain-containing protein [Vibrio splendidus]|uniref:DUF2971 domain-containing protein n=1 Tax=Vibrio splendidus TaxID=29497 RepID=UPI001FB1DAC2|nr:DUF2971 domain-containing protein [Vibrio splendidus]UOE85169.1 DUF2971 domain-containing protein [Vibrio splendidus]